MTRAMTEFATERVAAGMPRRRLAKACQRIVDGTAARRGAAAIEFGLLAPMLMTLAMGISEFAWLYHVENEMAYVARAVSRDVAVGIYQTAEAETEVTNRLSHFGYPFTVNVNEVANDVTIDITVPMADAALVNFLNLFGTGTLDASVTMRKA